ncbi:MAG: transglutaminase-like cysteine peptidase [Aestuariivirgaceae bacterium]
MYPRLLSALAFGLLAMAPAAHAVESSAQTPAKERAFATIYGKTLPPIGFVEFCARDKKHCVSSNSPARRLVLTEAHWKQLQRVNVLVNSSIAPVSDLELYAVPERWDYPVDAGDCEDYVLLKKRKLEDLDFPSHALLITVVLDEAGEGHAVLTVSTDQGDFVLDNRRNAIIRWTETRYRFLKRQSQDDPRLWVALSEVGKTSVVEAAKQD